MTQFPDPVELLVAVAVEVATEELDPSEEWVALTSTVNAGHPEENVAEPSSGVMHVPAP